MKEYKSLLSLLKEEDAAAKAYNAFMGAYETEVQDMNERLVAFPIVDDVERFVREEMAESAKKFLRTRPRSTSEIVCCKNGNLCLFYYR